MLDCRRDDCRDPRRMQMIRVKKSREAILSAIAYTVLILVSAFYIGNRTVSEYSLMENGIEPMPEDYLDPSPQGGRIKEIKYRVPKPDGSRGTEIRRATVYLPYGYSKKEKYEIMYLYHGRGGDYRTWLGTAEHPREFKNLLDNMIRHYDIPPLIVVTPNLPYDYGSDDAVMEGASYELAKCLMPAVEKRFSTYSERKTDPKSFRKSRNHRCIAGFSMGGSVTWHVLKDHMDYFRYYMPMSMAMYYDKNGYSKAKSLKAAKEISESVEASGYGQGDFMIFAASGDEDHKAEATVMQILDLVDTGKKFGYSDYYLSKKKNTMIKVWPGRWHEYSQSYPYLYNGLIHFYNDAYAPIYKF
jgi:enterochelin esterase-like enzyme